ncbi:MAG: hypothetical protein QXL96_08350 [Ignisphaera sp.]
MSRRKIHRSLVFLLFIALFTLYSAELSQVIPTYYTDDDVFGPLSIKFSLVLLACVMISSIVIFLTYGNTGHGDSSSVLHYLVAVLPLLFKYLLPNALDAYYVTNFYDAVGHMTRGAYVSITGHSDPSVDAYFDLQPGFFWWTSVFVNVIWGPPGSRYSPVFEVLIKHFNMLFLSLSIPMVICLFRAIGLTISESFIAYSIFTLISYGRFHYSAQAYTYLLYWVFLVLLFKSMKGNILRSSLFVSIILVAISLVFLHQGSTLYSLISIFSLLIASILSRLRNHRGNLNFLAIVFLTFSATWLSYLAYMTIFTFRNFIDVLMRVYDKILEGGGGIVAKSIERPYMLWQNVVIFKAVFFTGMTVLSLTVLIVYATKKRPGISSHLLAVSLGIVLALSPIALSLGGAGYIERIYEILTPFVSFSLLLPLRENRMRKGMKARVLLLTLITISSTLGYCIYFSGWNFQSVTYSGYLTDKFVIEHGPNIALTYSQLPLNSMLELNARNVDLRPNQFYLVQLHDEIYFLYYIAGSSEIVYEVKVRIINDASIIYSSKTSVLAYKS